jgi:hypothetical protein
MTSAHHLRLCDFNPPLSPHDPRSFLGELTNHDSLLPKDKKLRENLTACPRFLISPYFRKFKGCSFLMFYLPKHLLTHLIRKFS